MLTVTHLQKTFGALQASHTSAATGFIDYAAIALDPKYAEFRDGVCEFRSTDLGTMKETTRLAFLINLYNLMILHAFAQLGGASGTPTPCPSTPSHVYASQVNSCGF